MSKRGIHLQSANREAAIQDTTVRQWKKRWLTPQPIQSDPPTTTNTTHTQVGAGGGYGQPAIEHVAAAPLQFKVLRWIRVDDLPGAAQLEVQTARVLHGGESGKKETQLVVDEEVEDCPGVHSEDVWLEQVSGVNVLRRVEAEPTQDGPTAAENIPATAVEIVEQPTEIQEEQQEETVEEDAEMLDASAAIADNTLVPVTQPAPEDEQGPSAVAAPDPSPAPGVDAAAGSELAEPVAAAADVAAGLVPVADPVKPAEMDAVDASIPAATPVDGSAPSNEA